MKGLVVLIVLVGVGIWGAYQFGMQGMDPAVEAQQFSGKVQPGMTWEQVADVKAPRKFYPFSGTGEGGGGEFDREGFKVVAPTLGQGFNFKYQFSGDHAYQVNFDETGKVSSVEKMRTFNDLATGKTWQN